MSEKNENKNKPALNVFTRVQTQDGTTKIGSQVGVAFAFKEKAGYNIFLDVQPFPINGKIELVAFPTQDPS
jgi:hypothetical protein